MMDREKVSVPQRIWQGERGRGRGREQSERERERPRKRLILEMGREGVLDDPRHWGHISIYLSFSPTNRGL